MPEPLIAEIGGIPPAVIEYPLTVEDLESRHPLITWRGSDLTFEDTDWDGHWYTRVAPTPQPQVAWGERAVEGAPTLDAGTWRQTWTVQSITLAEAKAQLADMAIVIYWTRMFAPPSVNEFQTAGRNGVTVLQGRSTRFQSSINSVATRIQAATTIAEAYTIYLELEALA